MPEPVWITLSALLALMAIMLFFPQLRAKVSRWGRGLFYLAALVAILGWTLLKSCFVLLGRRLLRG